MRNKMNKKDEEDAKTILILISLLLFIFMTIYVSADNLRTKQAISEHKMECAMENDTYFDKSTQCMNIGQDLWFCNARPEK